MDFSKRVRARRRALDLSQEALARRADVSMSLVNQLERGLVTDPHYSTLVGLAEALDMSISELIGEEQVEAGKDQALLPSEEEDTRRRVYQGITEFRVELLQDAADLWVGQISRGQYDLQTLQGMDDVAFKLSMNHRFDSGVMRQYCTQQQRELLERAENKFYEAYKLVWTTFETKLEQEKARLSKEQLSEFERYKAKRDTRRSQPGLGATGT